MLQVRALAAEVAGAFRDLLQLNHRMGRIQVGLSCCMAHAPLLACGRLCASSCVGGPSQPRYQ